MNTPKTLCEDVVPGGTGGKDVKQPKSVVSIGLPAFAFEGTPAVFPGSSSALSSEMENDIKLEED